MSNQLDNPDKTNMPKAIPTVNIEWNFDLDDQLANIQSIGDQERQPGKESNIRFKGRCRRCWGGLIAKRNPDDVVEAIRCRVCGILFEGEEARGVFRQMSKEQSSHILNIAYEQDTKYSEEGIFVQKVFPYIERLSKQDFQQRIAVQRPNKSKDGWLIRGGFPAGSAGYLFLQAKALMSGVECLPREKSVANFPDSDINDDGSATVYFSKEELSKHPKTLEYDFMKKLGSTMTVSMMSAFACELAMKAIRLTCTDNARKSHDLWELYCDLPTDSKKRIEKDFPDILKTLEKARYTFDKWRYFEANVGGQGISAMTDTKRAFDLAKAARVILDEAEMVGLGYSVNVKAKRRITKVGNRTKLHFTHDLKARGTETPPKR